MAVKTVFKILILTIVCIVLTSIIIEVINLNLVALQINQLSKIATRQACVLFGQETYKREDAPLVDVQDIVGVDGYSAVSGNFYGYGKLPEDIYDELYTHNTDFRAWTQTTLEDGKSMVGRWKNLDILLLNMGIPTKLPPTIEEQEEYFYMSEIYTENRMTPLNLGITYLDKNIVEKIMKWNMAAIFSDGKQEMVIDNDGPEIYIKYKGFRIYVNRASITDISYRVYNIVNSRDAFKSLTNIDSIELGITDANDERANICVAGIAYRLPVAYEGVTPLRQIIEYTWNTRVQGMKNGTNTVLPYNDSLPEAALEAGGFDGNNSLPVAGQLIYYVIR